MGTNITDAKSSMGEFKLPGGYLNGDILFDRVTLRELTGREEDFLSAPNVDVNKKMNSVLVSCIKKISTNDTRSSPQFKLKSPKVTSTINDGQEDVAVAPAVEEDSSDAADYDDIVDADAKVIAVNNMTLGDRVFLIIALRRVSLGDDFEFSINCPECNKEMKKVVDLSALDIEEMSDKRKRFYDITLPSGKGVRMRVLLGKDEEKITSLASKKRNIMSQALLTRIESIDDEPASINILQELSLKDRNYIRQVFSEEEGGVDTTIGILCSDCSFDFDTELNMGDTNFFFPSV